MLCAFLLPVSILKADPTLMTFTATPSQGAAITVSPTAATPITYSFLMFRAVDQGNNPPFENITLEARVVIVSGSTVTPVNQYQQYNSNHFAGDRLAVTWPLTMPPGNGGKQVALQYRFMKNGSWTEVISTIKYNISNVVTEYRNTGVSKFYKRSVSVPSSTMPENEFICYDSLEVHCDPGSFTSTVSQNDANAKAYAYLDSIGPILVNRYACEEQTKYQYEEVIIQPIDDYGRSSTGLRDIIWNPSYFQGPNVKIELLYREHLPWASNKNYYVAVKIISSSQTNSGLLEDVAVLQGVPTRRGQYKIKITSLSNPNNYYFSNYFDWEWD
jgi:hypothetical protein